MNTHSFMRTTLGGMLINYAHYHCAHHLIFSQVETISFVIIKAIHLQCQTATKNKQHHSTCKNASSIHSSAQSLICVRLLATLMNPSTPGLTVHHQLPEFTETHVHRVGDAIQPSHPLSSPSPPTFDLPQHQALFYWVSSESLNVSRNDLSGASFHWQQKPVRLEEYFTFLLSWAPF